MRYTGLDKDADQRILNARAHALAKKTYDETHDETHDRTASFLIFSLGINEKYAISYDQIEKVIALPILTLVPGVPSLFLGVMYHNAQVWPVINTEALLGFSAKEEKTPDYVILLRDGAHGYALSVRCVIGHMPLDTSDVHASLAGKKGPADAYVLGVSQSDITVMNDKAIINFMNQVSF